MQQRFTRAEVEVNEAMAAINQLRLTTDPEIADVEREVEQLRRQVVALEAELEERQDMATRDVDDLTRQLSSMRDAHRDAEAALNAIASSTTWRITAPVRKTLDRHPRLARMGRRSIKATWWMVTGQLPARLKERRAMRRAAASQVPLADGHAIKSPFRVIPRYIDAAASLRNPPSASASRIGIHLHLYYLDLLDEFISRFRNIPFKFDLFVSIPDFLSLSQIEHVESVLRQGLDRAERIVIKRVENRGRDIAPFIIDFGKELLGYDIVGHFHTKKSPHNPKLQLWRDDILDLLLGPAGNRGGHIAQIFEIIEKQAKIVFPEITNAIQLDPTGWAGNQSIASNVLAKHSRTSIDRFPIVEFPAGTMMWARSSALRELLSLPLEYRDFPHEPITADGTLAHALERLVFILAHDVEGELVRLTKRDSVPDYRFFEEAQDFSVRSTHRNVKVLAYYLPQFHPIPENDKWHGKGFTEWMKVRAANPLFRGHYQQHIPHPEVGYYLIDSPDVLRRQADDMKKAGVYGQVFYHYWFGGKLILEHPAQMLRENTDIEMPFCFCWANENWTRRWDGSEHEILLKQDYSEDDARAFINYLMPFFRDHRYIAIGGRPVIFIYRPSSIPIISKYIEVWGRECEAAGLQRPYVVATLAAGTRDPRDCGLDAGAERVLYDWTDGKVPDMTAEVDGYAPITGRVFSYERVKEYYSGQAMETDFTCFRSVVPNWDNTARYGTGAHLVHGSTPRLFQEWLEVLVSQTERTLPEDRQFVLINAWNEWAEGAHLEADTRYGYAYLNAVGRALSNESYRSPALDSHQALAVARVADLARANGAMMMVMHRWGGGTEQHVEDMRKALESEGITVFFTRVAVNRPGWIVVEREGVELGAFDVSADFSAYARFLRRLHVRHLHIQHLVGFPESTADWLRAACGAAGIQYDVTVHDYTMACPRIFMTSAANTYCGEPPTWQCEICVKTAGSPFGQPSVADWRTRHQRLLEGARKRFVPNEDVAERLSRYFHDVEFSVRPHPEPRRNAARLRSARAHAANDGGREIATAPRSRHVVVVGHLAGHKGFDLLLKCAKFASTTRAPIHFTVLGVTDDDSAFSNLKNVTLLGRYDTPAFLEIIERLSPDLAFFPSVCPETYSFTLSETMAAGVYPVVFDLGAMARRVRSIGWGKVLATSLMTAPAAVVEALLETNPTPPSPGVFELTQGREYPDVLHDYYDLSWTRGTSGVIADHGKARSVEHAELRRVRFNPPGREAALFVTHALPDGRLKPHVQRYVSSLAAAGISVYLIIASDLPSQVGELDEVYDASGIFVRYNEGYDFAAWAHVMREHPEFKAVDILFFTNDSVVGPLHSTQLTSALARVRDGDAQVYGLTENFEKGWHLQSYFLAVKQPALGSHAFDAFFAKVVSLSDKEKVIDNYEVTFAATMARAGFRAEALFSIASERNQTLYFWRELLLQGFPFVKIQAGRDPLPGVDRKEIRRVLKQAGFSATELDPIFQADRTSHVVNSTSATPLLSFAPYAERLAPLQHAATYTPRTEAEELRQFKEMVLRSRTWRMTKPALLLLTRVARGNITTRDIIRRVRSQLHSSQ